MKSLIAADDPVTCFMLESALRSLGHPAVIVHRGAEAWKEIQLQTVQLVICDWWMPDFGGLDLCRMMRAGKSDYVYCLLLTGQNLPLDEQRAAAMAGVDDFLCKPVNPHELWRRLHMVERILGYVQRVRRLESLLPVCHFCKKQHSGHDDPWQQVGDSLAGISNKESNYAVCPECYEKYASPRAHAVTVSTNTSSLVCYNATPLPAVSL